MGSGTATGAFAFPIGAAVFHRISSDLPDGGEIHQILLMSDAADLGGVCAIIRGEDVERPPARLLGIRVYSPPGGMLTNAPYEVVGANTSVGSGAVAYVDNTDAISQQYTASGGTITLSSVTSTSVSGAFEVSGMHHTSGAPSVGEHTGTFTAVACPASSRSAPDSARPPDDAGTHRNTLSASSPFEIRDTFWAYMPPDPDAGTLDRILIVHASSTSYQEEYCSGAAALSDVEMAQVSFFFDSRTDSSEGTYEEGPNATSFRFSIVDSQLANVDEGASGQVIVDGYDRQNATFTGSFDIGLLSGGFMRGEFVARQICSP